MTTALKCAYLWIGAALLAGFLCWPGMHAPFVYDDLHSIANNPHLTWGDLLRVFWDPSLFSGDPDKAMYRPLLLVSYILNGTADPFALRVGNIVLHAGSALLVALIASALGLQRWSSAVAGLLFLVHPAGIQPMLYVSARSDALLTFFFLWSIYWWLEAGPCWQSLVGMACALLTKEVAVVLPACFLVLDFLDYRRETWKMDGSGIGTSGWIMKRLCWPLAMSVLVMQIHLFSFTQAAPAPRGTLAQFSTQLEALGFYAKSLVYPVGYVLDPAFAEVSYPTPLGIACWAGLLGLLAHAWHLRSRIPLVCLLLAVLSLLVVMVAPLNLLVNYRRLYLPAAFFCISWAWLTEYSAGGESWLRKWVVAVFAVATLGQFAWASHSQALTWRSEKALWEENTTRAPSQPRPWLYLAANLRQEALREEAEDAKKMKKSNPYGMRGTELYRLYHPEATAAWAGAEAALQRCIELTDNTRLHWRAVNNLGTLCLELNDLPGAEKYLQRAYLHTPEDADVLTNMGNIKGMRGDRRAAADFYQKALAQNPRHREAMINLELVRPMLDKGP